MATDTYHKFNFLKCMIIEALFEAYTYTPTAKKLQAKGYRVKKVANALFV